MARRAARVDDNQTEIVKYLRSLGANVAITSSAGKGFTDCVVGIGGETCLVEIKDGNKAPSKRVLTADEKEFHKTFTGRVYTVEDELDCLQLIGSMLEDAMAKTHRRYQIVLEVKKAVIA